MPLCLPIFNANENIYCLAFFYLLKCAFFFSKDLVFYFFIFAKPKMAKRCFFHIKMQLIINKSYKGTQTFLTHSKII